MRLEAGDQEGIQRLIQYFLRCPFSQARMIEVTDAGKDGWYSNQTRGQRAQRQPAPAGTAIPARSPTAREARQGWAALIRQVVESDPLTCPKCGTTMRIAFRERRQTEKRTQASSITSGSVTP